MHASSTVAAALLALAPAVHAVGNAQIFNKCDFDVYVWSVSVGVFDGPTTMSANTGSFTQQYKTLAEGGMSLKLSKTQSLDSITQFEYTLGPDTVWYDLSNVNCQGDDCPFQSTGMYMESGSGCPTVTCPAGNATCGGAYTKFNDDWASKACSPSADTTVYLCQESADGSSSSSGSSSDDSVSDSSVSTAGADSEKGFIGASAPDSSSSAASSSSSSSAPEIVAAAATSAPASTPSPKAKPTPSTTSTSSYSTPTSSVAPSSEAPATTAAPAPNYVETTLITYVTQYSTQYVDAHDKFHKEKRAPIHPHARRHQHH